MEYKIEYAANNDHEILVDIELGPDQEVIFMSEEFHLVGANGRIRRIYPAGQLYTDLFHKWWDKMLEASRNYLEDLQCG